MTARLYTVDRIQAVWERERFHIPIPDNVADEDQQQYVEQLLDAHNEGLLKLEPSVEIIGSVESMDTTVEIVDGPFPGFP